MTMLTFSTTTDAATPANGVASSVVSNVTAVNTNGDSQSNATADGFEIVDAAPSVQLATDNALVASDSVPALVSVAPSAVLASPAAVVPVPALVSVAPSAVVASPAAVVPGGPAAIGTLCSVVPSVMLVNPLIESADYYVVTKGRKVGIVTQAGLATALITGIPGGANKHYDTQQMAVDAFNALLQIPGVVSVHLESSNISSPSVMTALDRELEAEFDRLGNFLDSLDPEVAEAAWTAAAGSKTDDDLANALQGLNLHQERPRTPPPQTRYRLVSPKKAVALPNTTNDWSEAGAILNDNDNVRAFAEVRRSKQRHHSKAWVVFVGSKPGIYSKWSEVEEQQKSGPSVQQGYLSKDHAQAAFRHAVSLGLVATVTPDDPRVRVAAVPAIDNFLTAPESAFANPINAGATNKRWYCVYQGRNPSIFGSLVECQLNVLGVSKAVHESWDSLSQARRKFSDAQKGGRVCVRM